MNIGRILIGVGIGLVVSNFGYQFFTGKEVALERSFFQVVALLAVYIVTKLP